MFTWRTRLTVEWMESVYVEGIYTLPPESSDPNPFEDLPIPFDPWVPPPDWSSVGQINVDRYSECWQTIAKKKKLEGFKRHTYSSEWVDGYTVDGVAIPNAFGATYHSPLPEIKLYGKNILQTAIDSRWVTPDHLIMQTHMHETYHAIRGPVAAYERIDEEVKAMKYAYDWYKAVNNNAEPPFRYYESNYWLIDVIKGPNWDSDVRRYKTLQNSEKQGTNTESQQDELDELEESFIAKAQNLRAPGNGDDYDENAQLCP